MPAVGRPWPSGDYDGGDDDDGDYDGGDNDDGDGDLLAAAWNLFPREK